MTQDKRIINSLPLWTQVVYLVPLVHCPSVRLFTHMTISVCLTICLSFICFASLTDYSEMDMS